MQEKNELKATLAEDENSIRELELELARTKTTPPAIQEWLRASPVERKAIEVCPFSNSFGEHTREQE